MQTLGVYVGKSVVQIMAEKSGEFDVQIVHIAGVTVLAHDGLQEAALDRRGVDSRPGHVDQRHSEAPGRGRSRPVIISGFGPEEG